MSNIFVCRKRISFISNFLKNYPASLSTIEKPGVMRHFNNKYYEIKVKGTKHFVTKKVDKSCIFEKRSKKIFKVIHIWNLQLK